VLGRWWGWEKGKEGVAVWEKIFFKEVIKKYKYIFTNYFFPNLLRRWVGDHHKGN